jgi:ppGpp synthetase/RelA/SpoT-type nucleotidyltranferase
MGEMGVGGDRVRDDGIAGLGAELEGYLREDEAAVVFQCYGLASASVKADSGFTQRFVDLAAASSRDLARLRLPPEFVAADLLYHAASSGNLKVPIRAIPGTDLGRRIQQVLVQLLDTGNVFDYGLPWRSRDEEGTLQARLQRDAARGSLWTDVPEADAGVNSALLGALFSHRVPEIPIVKAVDRLHFLESRPDPALPEAVFRLLAREAIEVHARALEILGVYSVRWRLEDRGFRILDPERYEAIAADLAVRRADRESVIEEAKTRLAERLQAAGLKVTVTGRPKHLYGLLLKHKKLGWPIAEINDSLAIRVLVATKDECYRALATIHDGWKPVEGIYEKGYCRDWIASPKPSGYQSIHTTVWFGTAPPRRLEVQIRTKAMHELAEYGVAAHWLYKDQQGSQSHAAYARYVERMAGVRRQMEGRPDR